jgi:hypothetical protein
MKDKPEDAQAGKAPRYVTDKELAPLLRVSAGFLQKDRITAQRIPFVRLGDRCLYDLDEALAAVKALSVGGARGRRGRRSTSVEGA